MNHGSLGHIDEDGSITLNHEIIDSLCLGDKSKLYGIYYPCPSSKRNPLYQFITLKHDFMLTPIPYRFWAVSAKLFIHLNQHLPSLNKVCEYLESKRVSIIHSESTRSGYRYATWSLHIAFEDLLNSADLLYENKLHCYRGTQTKLSQLIKSMKEDRELRKYLYKPDSFEAVEGTVNSPLACFTNFVQNNELSDNDKQIVNPFELTLSYTNDGKIFTGDTQYQFVINYLKSKQPELFPAITFSELHERALNIRNVLIPRKDSKRFFRIGIEFQRIGGKDSSVGIIHSITQRLENYSIWQSYNYTINSSSDYDKGNLVFLVENITSIGKKSEDGRSKNSYLEEAETDIQRIITEAKFENISFEHPVVIPLPEPLAVKSNLQNEFDQRERKDYKYDVFISYSHNESDKKFVDDLVNLFREHHLVPHVDRNVFKFGETIDSTLLANILNSREMCVVVTKDSVLSEWVTTEWGAAWVLGKNLVPIILKADFQIPDRLKKRYYVNGDSPSELKAYAKQLVDAKLTSEAKRFKYYFSK